MTTPPKDPRYHVVKGEDGHYHIFEGRSVGSSPDIEGVKTITAVDSGSGSWLLHGRAGE